MSLALKPLRSSVLNLTSRQVAIDQVHLVVHMVQHNFIYIHRELFPTRFVGFFVVMVEDILQVQGRIPLSVWCIVNEVRCFRIVDIVYRKMVVGILKIHPAEFQLVSFEWETLEGHPQLLGV